MESLCEKNNEEAQWSKSILLLTLCSHLGFRNFLLLIDREEQIVAVGEAAMHPFPSPVAVQLGALRQPHFYVASLEMDGTIIHQRVVSNQADLWHRCNQVRFHANDLVAVCRDPGPPSQRHRIRRAILPKPVGPNRIRFIRPLPEMHLPRRPSIPLAQALATHREIPGIVGMKNER